MLACGLLVALRHHQVCVVPCLQHGYSEIVEWYRKLAEEHGDLVRYVASIGKSLEGRDQPAVHIGKGGNRIIYFQCQIHASKHTCNVHTHNFLHREVHVYSQTHY